MARHRTLITPGRPRWLTRGAIRLAILCAFIVLVDMLSPRMSRDDAGIVLVVGLVALVGGAAAVVLATRAGTRGRAAAVLGLLRHVGLPLIGLAFFLVWTLVYIGAWWYRPDGAFSGLSVNPRFADFFYYAVSTGLISPPGDIIAGSRGARSATLVEMVTGLALLGAYLSSFSDMLAVREGDDGG
jgi:hypothetical protein